jgi:elongation factor Ts
MEITPAMVKDLRERTGAGMMECKKALADAGGNLEAAVEVLRKKGAASADKKAGRIAAEGVVLVSVAPDRRRGVLVEINCETDFVAKDENFKAFANAVADLVLQGAAADVEALKTAKLNDGVCVEEARKTLVGKIGENIAVRRFAILRAPAGGRVAGYAHGSRIGTLVVSSGGREDLGRDLAMHVAASRPQCLDRAQVPAELIARERDIYLAQAQGSGKPANVLDKIIEGKLQKFLGEITLLGQPFVKDPDITVAKLLDKEGARVAEFVRFEVGEGLEKRADDFAAEVMAQVKGT